MTNELLFKIKPKQAKYRRDRDRGKMPNFSAFAKGAVSLISKGLLDIS